MNHYTLSYTVKLVRRTTNQEYLAALLAITTRYSVLCARFRKRIDKLTWKQYIAPAGFNCFVLESDDFREWPHHATYN